jgi:hypothetical protein
VWWSAIGAAPAVSASPYPCTRSVWVDTDTDTDADADADLVEVRCAGDADDDDDDDCANANVPNGAVSCCCICKMLRLTPAVSVCSFTHMFVNRSKNRTCF